MRPIKLIKYKRDTIVKIGQPADYPVKIVERLKKEFSKFANIDKACLGWIHDPSTNVPPHLIIGLDMIGDINPIIYAVNGTIEQFLKESDIVDFVKMDRNEGIVSYLSKTEPFYKR
jgi:hypothetical protein